MRAPTLRTCSRVPDQGGRLGIMQPYFFPHLGHFALIASVDRWVVLDVTQYTPKTWMNRNRVLHPNESWMYVTVPVSHASRNKLIREVVLNDPERSLIAIQGKLAHYRKKAPHYDVVVGIVEQAFAGRSGNSLAALDISALRTVCDYLEIGFEFDLSSEMGLDLASVAHPGQWALRISEQLRAHEYVNPIGGAGLFRPAEFDESGIRLTFLDIPPMAYDSGPYQFVPSLSVIDVLMWNDPVDVRKFIEDKSTFFAAEVARARS